MPVLTIVIASTRPGRIGDAVGRWLTPIAQSHGGFSVQVVDLAEVNLPMMDEPNHPRMQNYTHDHTKAWSTTVAGSDAFVFVMPEYNYSFTAPLKNALDYLFAEWQHKPVGLVSYGGVSGGLRAAQQIKQVITTLSMMPIVEAVTLPMVRSLLGEDGEVTGNEMINASAVTMLDSLVRWEAALRTLRPQVEDDAAGEA